MQSDTINWCAIGHGHCCFSVKVEKSLFCRNEDNVNGVCCKTSCPLANSRYATIHQDGGVLYLKMKTIERAHQPNRQWERCNLPKNYEQALELIDKLLMYFPKDGIHRAKQRYTRLYQTQDRSRKLALKTSEKIVTTPRKEIKREARREEKAEKAAVLEKSIEKELLERLIKGVYGDNYNYPYAVEEYNKALMEEEEHEIEYVEDCEDLEEEDDIEDFRGFGIYGSYEDNMSVGSYEDMVASDGKRSLKSCSVALKKCDKGEHDTIPKKKKRARVLVEVEHEETHEMQMATTR